MAADHLTRPERTTDRALAREIRDRILRCKGCAMCTRRVEGFDLIGCGEWLKFPACVDSPRGFQLDEETV